MSMETPFNFSVITVKIGASNSVGRVQLQTNAFVLKHTKIHNGAHGGTLQSEPCLLKAQRRLHAHQ